MQWGVMGSTGARGIFVMPAPFRQGILEAITQGTPILFLAYGLMHYVSRQITESHV